MWRTHTWKVCQCVLCSEHSHHIHVCCKFSMIFIIFANISFSREHVSFPFGCAQMCTQTHTHFAHSFHVFGYFYLLLYYTERPVTTITTTIVTKNDEFQFFSSVWCGILMSGDGGKVLFGDCLECATPGAVKLRTWKNHCRKLENRITHKVPRKQMKIYFTHGLATYVDTNNDHCILNILYRYGFCGQCKSQHSITLSFT